MNSINQSTKNRVQYYDISRIICMIGVIIIHVVGHRLDDFSQPALWHTANLIEGFVRFSVPVFMMITGALLLKSDSALSFKYILKRIARVAIPASVWSCLYLAVICTQKFTSSFDFETLWSVLSKIFETPIYGHLWYVYALIAFYILLPILRILVKNCSIKTVGYALLVWFVASSLLPTLESVSSVFRITPDADLNVRSGYIGFFVLGYFLDNIKIKIKPIYLVVGYISFSLATSALTFIFFKLRGDGVRPFYEYFSPNIVLSASFAFVLLKLLFEHSKYGEKGNISIISNAVFGVYLSHEFVRTMLFELVKELNPFVEMIVSLMLTTVISFALSILLTHTRVLSYIFTGQKNPAVKTAGKKNQIKN